MKTFPQRSVWAGCIPLIALLLTAGVALANAPAIHLRMVDRQLQLGTDADAPAYYVQYRSPTTEWQTWTSKSIVPDSQGGIWFRAIFESNPEDPMEWELAADVDQVLSREGAIETTEDKMSWSVIGEFDEDSTFTAAYDQNHDPALSLASRTVPIFDTPTPAHNQAVATPDSGQATLYWRNLSTGQPVAWHLSDTGIRKSGLVMSSASPATSWVMEATADVDGDGALDLIWRNTSTGRVIVWFLDPDGAWRSSQQVIDANLSTAWRIVGADDVDGDAVPDLIWYNGSTRRAVVWFLNASGTRRDSISVFGSSVAAGWQMVDVADMDGDGVPDLVWFNTLTRRSVIWFLVSDGTFREQAHIIDSPVASGWSIVGVADVDSDGVPDIFWHHRSTGRVFIWFLESDGTRRAGKLVLDANISTAWRVVGVSDVDGDGTPDLLWHHLSTGRAVVWFLDSEGAYASGQAVVDANLNTAWRVEVVSRPVAAPVQ